MYKLVVGVFAPGIARPRSATGGDCGACYMQLTSVLLSEHGAHSVVVCSVWVLRSNSALCSRMFFTADAIGLFNPGHVHYSLVVRRAGIAHLANGCYFFFGATSHSFVSVAGPGCPCVVIFYVKLTRSRAATGGDIGSGDPNSFRYEGAARERSC